MKTALFLLNQIFNTISYVPLLEAITTGVFLQETSEQLFILMHSSTRNPLSYSFQWNYKNFWDDFGPLIAEQNRINYELFISDDSPANLRPNVAGGPGVGAGAGDGVSPAKSKSREIMSKISCKS
jgi:hypothetical protein